MNNRQRFFVHVDLGDGQPVVAGYHQLDPANHYGVFIYAGSYCDNPKAFALDPINLPLIFGKRFYFPIGRETTGIPGAFTDCGPDEWGKRILNQFASEKPISPADYLVMGSGFGVGALMFSDTKEPIEIDEAGRSLTGADELRDLATVYQSAIKFDTQADDWNHLERWLMPSSGIGGARPKAQVAYKGKACIAKFNRKEDTFDNALTEYCMMQLAENAGIECATVHLQKTEQGHCVLVERFDLGEGDKSQRRHMLSAYALLNVHKISQLDQVGYDRIGAVGKQIGNDTDIAQSVFTRMLFNIAIGNTDDHCRNHAFLKKVERNDYHLSPAYDLVPLPYRLASHAINVGPFGQNPTKDNISSCGKLMGLSKAQQQACAGQVATALGGLELKLLEWGLAETDLEVLKPCFNQLQTVRALADGGA